MLCSTIFCASELFFIVSISPLFQFDESLILEFQSPKENNFCKAGIFTWLPLTAPEMELLQMDCYYLQNCVLLEREIGLILEDES